MTSTAGRRRPEQQIELFGDEQSGAQGDTPTWQALPAATQAVLTSLIARLILDHAETRRLAQSWGPAMISDKIRPHHLEA